MKTGEMGPGHQFARAPLHRRQRGYVLFAVAFSIITIVGFAGLVIDVGMMQVYKRRAQAAADAGALGGALQMVLHGTSSLATAVTHDVSANGFTTGTNGVTVVQHNPPTSGQYIGKTSYVEVIVSKQVSMTFMQALGFSTATVAARAVGGPGASNTCIYVMNPSASGALSLGGSASLSSQCGIMVNSSSSTAIQVTGAACISAAPTISMTGGYSIKCGPAGVTPKTGITAVADPFAYLTAPTVGGCNYTNFTSAGGTLNPGVYCNGMSLTGGTITMNPGTYILSGGGLTVGSGANVQGAGVTFYNTAANGYAYRQISFTANSSTTLSAPTSGSYEGILFFTDRTITSSLTNIISGGGTSSLIGAVYMYGVPLQFTGNGSMSGYNVLVVGTLTMAGNTSVDNDYSTLTNGPPQRSGAVVAE